MDVGTVFQILFPHCKEILIREIPATEGLSWKPGQLLGQKEKEDNLPLTSFTSHPLSLPVYSLLAKLSLPVSLAKEAQYLFFLSEGLFSHLFLQAIGPPLQKKTLHGESEQLSYFHSLAFPSEEEAVLSDKSACDEEFIWTNGDVGRRSVNSHFIFILVD